MTQSTDIAGATCPKAEPQRQPERNKCVHGFWIQGGIETCPDGCTRTMDDETEQWIAAQVAQLSENELVLIKTVLDEIRAQHS